MSHPTESQHSLRHAEGLADDRTGKVWHTVADSCFVCLRSDAAGPEAGEGVYYQVISSNDPRVAVFNRMIVEYKVPVFGGSSADCHFEVILMADGSVIFQYMDMPADGTHPSRSCFRRYARMLPWRACFRSPFLDLFCAHCRLL